VELKSFEEEGAGANTHEARRMAVEKRDQLLELRAALKI
jgi:hypothetical protein